MPFDVIVWAKNAAAIGALPNCLASLEACDAHAGLQNITVAAAENRDSLVTEALSSCCPSLALRVLHTKAPLSFPQAAATAMRGSKTSWLVFLSAECTVSPHFFSHLSQAITTQPGTDAFEGRRLPFEAEHHIDPVTLESSFFDDMPFAISRSALERLGGFDRRLPDKASLVDFCLRLRADGGTISYLPRAQVWAATPSTQHSNAERDDYIQNEYGKLLMAYRYGKARHARRHYLTVLQKPRPFPSVRKILFTHYLRHFFACWHFLPGRKTAWPAAQAAYTQAVSFSRGTCALPAPVESGPKISVIVRTHNRTGALRCTLQSLANQTYQNFEVIVIEDGPAHSRHMVETEFSHLPLRYHATGNPVGRSKAGNLGLSMAAGPYCNFLDDDDYFYPDHLEQMAAYANQHPDVDLILGSSVAMMIDVTQEDPYTYTCSGLQLTRFDRLNVFTMCQMCQIPILSVCFKRSLYKQCGGLAENMDAHEDWAMWLRFLSVASRTDDNHIDIPRATCVFAQPASQTAADARLTAYMAYDHTLFADESIRFDVSIADMRRFYDGMLADMAHLQQTGRLDEFLQREMKREEPPDA